MRADDEDAQISFEIAANDRRVKINVSNFLIAVIVVNIHLILSNPKWDPTLVCWNLEHLSDPAKQKIFDLLYTSTLQKPFKHTSGNKTQAKEMDTLIHESGDGTAIYDSVAIFRESNQNIST